MKLILSSILLGFGGFDPMGAIIIMTALAHGAKKKQVYSFSLMALFSTILFGTIFSYCTNKGITYFSNLFKYIPDIVYVVIDLLLCTLCFIWLIKKIFFKEKEEVKENKKESKFMEFARKSMPLAGFLFGFWAMSDPTFWTVVALTAKEGNLPITMLCSGIWMVLGQLPLYVLTIAVIFNAHDKVLKKINDFLDKNNRRAKVKKIADWIIALFILAIGIYFLIAPIVYLIKGIWIY